MKIQVTTTTTTTKEKEFELPFCARIDDFQCFKILSETEVIVCHVWDCDSFNAGKIEQRKDAKDVLSSKHEEITESEFQAHLTRAKQIIDEAYNKAVVKSIGFGERNDYEVGEVVVWNGKDPCICKLASRCDDLALSCYKSRSESHDSLHYRHLRPATPEEINLLGEKEIHYL